jgi:hypothetical protein
MKTKQLLLTAALTVGAALTAFAATTQTVVFTATMPGLLELTTTSNTAGITLALADFASADAITKESLSAHSLMVRSNRPWLLSAKSGAANFAFTPSTAGDTRTKPSTDLSVRKTGGSYQTLSTADVTVTSGVSGGAAVTGNTFAMDYKLASDITLDPPGTYTLSVVYTLTAP